MLKIFSEIEFHAEKLIFSVILPISSLSCPVVAYNSATLIEPVRCKPLSSMRGSGARDLSKIKDRNSVRSAAIRPSAHAWGSPRHTLKREDDRVCIDAPFNLK